MELGNLKLSWVQDGRFLLDGGAMFGVVPKPLWEKKKPADELNRISMVTNCLLIERGDELVLVDTGIGDKHDAKFRSIFGLRDGDQRLPEALKAAGYDVGDISHVLLTHLHFDHSGWNAREQGGKLVPTFPKARYWLQRGEVEHARDPSPRDRASYDPRNWEPLFEAGVVELFGEEGEPVTGVKAVRTPGHNRDMCIVLLDGSATAGGSETGPGKGPEESDGKGPEKGDGKGDGKGPEKGNAKGIFFADLVPTAAHVPYPWIMGYDLYPLQTLENKQRWLPLAAAEHWLCLFEHDPEIPAARLVELGGGRLEVEPIA